MCDSIALVDLERFGGLIFDKDMDYASIVRVHSTMVDGDVMFTGKTTAAPEIAVHTLRNL